MLLDDVVRGHVAAVARGVGGESYILGGENIALEDLVRSTRCSIARSESAASRSR
jgi:hypothetical protein